MEIQTIAWIVRIIIITLGIYFGIKIHKLLTKFSKKHPKVYKELGKPIPFTWNFQRGWKAMYKLHLRIILNDKTLPKEITQGTKSYRIFFGSISILFIILIITFFFIVVI